MKKIALTANQKLKKCQDDIRKYCKAQMAIHDILQEDVAEVAGVSQQTISAALRGESRLTLEIFMAVVYLADPPSTDVASLFEKR